MSAPGTGAAANLGEERASRTHPKDTAQPHASECAGCVVMERRVFLR